MSDFPKQVAGRITAETAEQLQEAIQKFHTNEGALVRAALDKFLPAFLAGGDAAEFSAKVAEATKDDAELRGKIERLLRASQRAKRTAGGGV